MKIISYISKHWSVRWRDVIIAAIQSAAVASGTFLLDQLSLVGLQFNIKQIASASAVVFIQHIVRKFLEPHKIITMQKLDKEELPIAEEVVANANDEGTVPPPIGDPTHPPKDESGDEGSGEDTNP